MEDKEIKKELDKIPDTDANGEPIYKIDQGETAGADDIEESPAVPLFVEDTSEAPQGTVQDIKNSTEE